MKKQETQLLVSALSLTRCTVFSESLHLCEGGWEGERETFLDGIQFIEAPLPPSGAL